MQASVAAPRPSGEVRPIFVIDDEPGIRNALALTLRRAGYVVEEFADFDGIVRALGQARPFLVVLDVALQRSDAVEVIQALSDHRFDGAVQLLSGNSSGLLNDLRLVGERRKLRMLPVLRKPCRMRAIRAVADTEAQAVAGAPSGDDPRAREPAIGPTERLPVSLDHALDQGRVEIWYQPQIDLDTGGLVGAECLSRIRQPTGEIALPGTFLPGASPAAIERLTEHVLRRALLDWPAFARAGVPLRPSVNVPSRGLSTFPLASLLRDCVPRAAGWRGLVLEITEEDAMRDVEKAHEAAIQLMIYGIELSIDDFGLGYSSLSRLRHIPFREIKLDRSLVHGCATDATRAALCRAVIDLAHSLDSAVVAEGVEVEDDLAFLRANGCDIAQGYLLGRPMPKADLLERITAGQYRDIPGAMAASRVDRRISAHGNGVFERG